MIYSAIQPSSHNLIRGEQRDEEITPIFKSGPNFSTQKRI